VLRFNRFQESRPHDVIDRIEYTVSRKRFIDGHGHNNDTLGYEKCVEKR